MKNRIRKKRLNNWKIRAFRWQLNYINGHHLRHTLISQNLLYKFIWSPRTYMNIDIMTDYETSFPNKQWEKNRLNRLWNIGNQK